MAPTSAPDKACLNLTCQLELSTSPSANIPTQYASTLDAKAVNGLTDSKYGETRLSVEHTFERSDHVECASSKWALFKTIIAGQMLSCMLCSLGTAATALNRYYNVKTPCFYAYLMYSLLALTFGARLAFRGNEFTTVLKTRGWKYFILAMLDVEANYMLTKAYSFTTLTSVQLCDSFTIPTVMLLSFAFLRVRYKIIHYVAVAICLSGAICLIFSDTSAKGENANNETLGDALAISAALLYGVANVAQEHLVKKFSSEEYLGMVGLCGALVSGIQTVAVEREAIASIHWQRNILLLLLAFAVCQFLYYAVMPYVMQLSSAAVVNLSLLTSDLYTMLVGLAVFQYKFSYVYFIAFGAIMSGLVIYNIKPTPVATRRTEKSTKKLVALGCGSDSLWRTICKPRSLPRHKFERFVSGKDAETETVSLNSSFIIKNTSGGGFGSFGYSNASHAHHNSKL